MRRFSFVGEALLTAAAHDVCEAQAFVEATLDVFSRQLPAPSAHIFIFANLHLGLPGPGNGTTDLRLIAALVRALRGRGYHNLSLGDGLASPAEGPAPSFYRRSRIDKLAAALQVPLVDLSRQPMETVALRGGRFRVASLLKQARTLLLPSVSVDPVLGLAAGLATLVGGVHPDDRQRLMAVAAQSLPDLARWVSPALTLADTLTVQEGYDPAAGLTPRRLDRLVACIDPLLLELFLGRLFGMTPEEMPAVWHAIGDRTLDPAAFAAVEEQVGVMWDLHRPLPPWRDGKREAIAAPASSGKALTASNAALAAEDTLGGLRRDPAACGSCTRCVAFCPMGLRLEQIGKQPRDPGCIECLYCVLVCPRDALHLSGDAGPLGGHLARARPDLERM